MSSSEPRLSQTHKGWIVVGLALVSVALSVVVSLSAAAFINNAIPY